MLVDELVNPTREIPIRIPADKHDGIYFYSTPLSDQDLVEAGGQVQSEEDLEHQMEQLILDHMLPG